MKKLHHIVLVLALAATLFTGCNKDEGVTPRPPVPETADQTIMFYLTGTNLGSYFRKNVDDAMNAIDRNILHNSRVLVFIQPQRGLSMVLELYYTPRNDDYVPGAQFSYEHCKVDTLRRWADADFNSMDRGTITEVISYMAGTSIRSDPRRTRAGLGPGRYVGQCHPVLRIPGFLEPDAECPADPLDGRFRQAG